MNKNTRLKKEDIQAVRTSFYKGGLHTRNDICAVTGLSPASVINVLQGLMSRKEILYISDAASTGGRRSKQYILNPDYGHIGMMICLQKQDEYVFHLMTMDLHGKCILNETIQSESGSREDFQKGLQLLLKEDGLVKTIVISIPGMAQDGVIRICDFEELEGFDLKQLLNSICPNWNMENDVNTACIGFAHLYPECRNAALIYQPYEEYAGCGLLINGHLYSGSTHRAGEMRYLWKERPGRELKDPLTALWKDICAIQAVMDPQVIGWASDLVEEKELLRKSQKEKYPLRLEHIENMEDLIQKGLYWMGMNLILEKEGEN